MLPRSCCVLPQHASDQGREERGRNSGFLVAVGLVCVGSSIKDDSDEKEESLPLLQSQYTYCLDHPHQELTIEKNAQPTFLYTRDGPVKTRQITKKCKACKTKYFHGYRYDLFYQATS